MDITTLAAWGEFLGGIAVVVSLVYLASQIRQNSKLLRASSASVSAAGQNRVTELMAQDPELSRIWFQGMRDRNGLSEPDRLRFDPLIAIVLGSTNQEYHLEQDGAVSPAYWKYRVKVLRQMFENPGAQQYWTAYGVQYADGFIELVDGLIHEGEAAGPTSPAS